MKYEGYYELLDKLNCKERKLIQQARLPSILKYELQTIQEEKPPVDVYGAGGEAEGFMPPEISTRVACRWRRGDEQVCESRSEQRGGRRHGNTGITY